MIYYKHKQLKAKQMSNLTQALNNTEMTKLIRKLSKAKTEEQANRIVAKIDELAEKQAAEKQAWADFFAANPEAGQ